MTGETTVIPTIPNQIERVRPDDLVFDRENPRLVGYGVTEDASDTEVLKLLWDEMDVQELVSSMAESGFFQHEPLIIAEEEGRDVVIEGNRRLAALRFILNPAIAEDIGAPYPEISLAVLESLREDIPAVRSSREAAWRFLGFKHVNGPARWNSYAKAKYIAGVHLKYGVPLKEVSRQIGDTHKTVQRLFRGYRVVEQAQETGVYDQEDRWHRGFYFSHIYTGLGYSGFTEYLRLKPEAAEDENPVPEESLPQLGQVLTWLYGSKKDGCPPLIKSQNPDLRQLEAVLRSREAVAALKTGTDLVAAFEMTRPVGTVLEEELVKAKQSLQKARGILSTGYDRSEGLLNLAGQIATIADDLCAEMERMREPPRSRRRRSIGGASEQ